MPAIAFPRNERGFAECYEFSGIRGVYCTVVMRDDEDDDRNRRHAPSCFVPPEPVPEYGIGVEFCDGDTEIPFISPDCALVCAVYDEYVRQRADRAEMIDIGAIRDAILAKRAEVA